MRGALKWRMRMPRARRRSKISLQGIRSVVAKRKFVAESNTVNPRLRSSLVVWARSAMTFSVTLAKYASSEMAATPAACVIELTL